jgi:hypothetical protein
MKDKNTIGIFHRAGSQVKFDPVDRAKKLKRYLDFYSDQSFDVRGFTYEGTQPTSGPTWARKDIDAFIKAGGTSGFDPFFRHILGGNIGGNRCGEAEGGGGNESVAFDTYGCGDKTTIHEVLHNGKGTFGSGLGHSHSIRNGKVDKLGDNTSIMGSNDHIVGMISPLIVCMGWFREKESVTIVSSQQVLIAPVEMAGLHPDEYKHVVLRNDGKNVYLSTRLDYPFDSGENVAEKLYIHELFPNGHPDLEGDFANATLKYEDMMPGDKRTLPNGFAVAYLSFVDGIARVEVTK